MFSSGGLTNRLETDNELVHAVSEVLGSARQLTAMP
jgi:hypothetical protein